MPCHVMQCRAYPVAFGALDISRERVLEADLRRAWHQPGWHPAGVRFPRELSFDDPNA